MIMVCTKLFHVLVLEVIYSILHIILCLELGLVFSFFFQAEDGIRDLVRSRGLGDVYKRQGLTINWYSMHLSMK